MIMSLGRTQIFISVMIVAQECLYMLGWIYELICNIFLYCFTLYTKTKTIAYVSMIYVKKTYPITLFTTKLRT